MARVLVLVPCGLPVNEKIHARLGSVLYSLRSTQHTIDISIDYNEPQALPGPYAAHANARNNALARFMTDAHDYVLWLDADIVTAPENLVDLLVRGDHTITAPLVLIEPPKQGHFYDTHGFRTLAGKQANIHPPYFSAKERHAKEIELASVGCVYVAPASLYRAGVRYTPTNDQTEHWSVCAAARGLGYRVVCLPEVRVEHAHLPHYGEEWHEIPKNV